MNITSPQFRRAFGLRFWLAALATMGLVFATYLRPMLQTIQEGRRFFLGYHAELMSKVLSSDTISAFIPALAGIPFAAGYLEDVKSRFARFFLVRSGYSRYLLGLCFCCWLSGGLALLLGASCAYGLTTLAMLPMEILMENPPERRAEIAIQLALLFLNGGFWTVVGMTVSTFMESKYIAYASPFVIYYLLIILCERYFTDAVLFYPRQWLNPGKGWPFDAWGVAVLLMELTVLMALVFYFRGKRRLEQL